MSSLFRKSVKWVEKKTPRWLFLAAYGSYACVKNTYNLLAGYGLLKSAYLWKSIDRNGNPIPWFSYPAIEYIEGLDLSGYSVFEYGSGHSTLFWSRRAQNVTAVEHDAAWMKTLQSKLGNNASIKLADSSTNDYADAIMESGAMFDLIIIDGDNRMECAKASVSRLRAGGFIILDDSDIHLEVADFLRSANLIQVDFAGFNPINTYTKTTSFFLHRDFQPKPRGISMPARSICHQ